MMAETRTNEKGCAALKGVDNDVAQIFQTSYSPQQLEPPPSGVSRPAHQNNAPETGSNLPHTDEARNAVQHAKRKKRKSKSVSGAPTSTTEVQPSQETEENGVKKNGQADSAKNKGKSRGKKRQQAKSLPNLSPYVTATESWAGGGFQRSPSPRSLPLPTPLLIQRACGSDPLVNSARETDDETYDSPTDGHCISVHNI